MSQTAEDFILRHAQVPYDPQRAHEYYLRTRELKGRKKGSKLPDVKLPKSAIAKADPHKMTAAQRREQAHARVVAIQARLDRLKEVLAQLVEQAQSRSGAKPSSAEKAKATEPAKQTANTKEKPKTAQQKKEDAKTARERYQKEHQSPAQQEEALRAQVKDVEKRIHEIRQQLKDSIQQARNRIPQVGLKSGAESADGIKGRHQ